VPAAGTYTISWDNQFVEKTAKLQDNEGRTIDMQEQSSYTFTTSVDNEINNRFSIQFAPASIPQVGAGQIEIHIAPGQIVLEGLSGHTCVRLYDLLGKQIHYEFTNGKTCRIDVRNQGVYIIEANNIKNKVICR
jgi:hypothetical protein